VAWNHHKIVKVCDFFPFHMSLSMSEDKLVRIACAGPGSPKSREAAAELLGRYQEAVFLKAYGYVKDRDRAMDIAQDVLLAAYQKIGTYKAKSRFSAWLFAITRNRCLNEMKRVGFLEDSGLDPDWTPDGNPGPDIIVEQLDSEDRFFQLIRETLDPVEQRAVWLRYHECVPVDEITRLMGIQPSSGARGVLQTARRKLKKAISRGESEKGMDR